MNKKIKVELLYFNGCPNWEQSEKLLQEVIDELELQTKIELINVEDNNDAIENRFLGSPSIRINDQDLEITEDKSTEYSMRCRRYRSGSDIVGHPSRELIVKAMRLAVDMT